MVLDATYISAKKQGASMKPSKHKMTVLSQIFKLIPRNLIPKLANEFGIDNPTTNKIRSVGIVYVFRHDRFA